MIACSNWSLVVCLQSTYCSSLYDHCQTVGRTIHIVNLDPAAEHFDYPVDMGNFSAYVLQCKALVHSKVLLSLIFYCLAFWQISES
jgi:hypothetical protein